MGKMTKTEKKIRSLQASAKNARTALKEHRTPGGVLMSEAPATIAGAGVVGATRAAGFTDFLGAPTDIALSIAFAGAGLASGSPALTRMSIGAASVAVARYVEDAGASFLQGSSGE